MEVQGKRRLRPVQPHPGRPASAPRRPAAEPRHEWLLGLQHSAGNRAASSLVSDEPAQVQREGWLESIGGAVGEAWDSASKTAGSIWDALTGNSAAGGSTKAADRPARPDHGATYTVTDAKALLRSPPPDLDSAALGGLLIPKGTPVKVLAEKRKGGKLFVEVAIVADPPIGISGGWTAYSNVSLRRGGTDPAKPVDPTDPGGGGGDGDLAEELERIKAIKVPAYVDKAGDEDKRKRAIEIANATTGARRADLLAELKKADPDLTPDEWFKGIQPSATFLGVAITGSKGFSVSGVHNELYEKLKLAEQLLIDSTGFDLDRLRKEFAIVKIGGLRPPKPATGKASGIGTHSYGLAIDLSVKTGKNPLLEDQFKGGKSASAAIIERARDFVKFGASSEFAVAGKASKGTGSTSWERRITQAEQWYDVMSDASQALKIYLEFETKTEVVVGSQTFRLEDLAAAFGTATGDVRSASEWQARIKEDRKKLTGGLLGADPGLGFLNLDKRLVMALVKAGLSWGGTLDREKDIHHFGLYDGTLKKKAVSSTAR